MLKWLKGQWEFQVFGKGASTLLIKCGSHATSFFALRKVWRRCRVALQAIQGRLERFRYALQLLHRATYATVRRQGILPQALMEQVRRPYKDEHVAAYGPDNDHAPHRSPRDPGHRHVLAMGCSWPWCLDPCAARLRGGRRSTEATSKTVVQTLRVTLTPSCLAF